VCVCVHMAAAYAPPVITRVFKAAGPLYSYKGPFVKGSDEKCTFTIDSLVEPDGTHSESKIIAYNEHHNSVSSKAKARENGLPWDSPWPGPNIEIETKSSKVPLVFRGVAIGRRYDQLREINKPRLLAHTIEDLQTCDGRLLASRKDYHAMVKSVTIDGYDTDGCMAPIGVAWFHSAMDADNKEKMTIKISKPHEDARKGLEIVYDEEGTSSGVHKPGENFLAVPVIAEKLQCYTTLPADSKAHGTKIPLHSVPCAAMHNPWFQRLIGFHAASIKAAIKEASDVTNVSRNGDQVFIIKEPDIEHCGFTHNKPNSILAWMIHTFHPWWRETNAYWFDVYKDAASQLAADGFTTPYPLNESKGVRYMVVVSDILDVFLDEMDRLISKPDLLSNLTHSGLMISFGPRRVAEQDKERVRSSAMTVYETKPMRIDIFLTVEYWPLTSGFPTLPPPTWSYSKPQPSTSDSSGAEEDAKSPIVLPPVEIRAGPKKKVGPNKYDVISASAPSVPVAPSASASTSSSSARVVTMARANLPYVDPADM
jgi:hypothetical protein